MNAISSLVDSTLIRQALVAVLSAWVMGQALAYVYENHREKTASRSFLQALMSGGIIGSMLMLAIGNSLARGVGIVATLSIIRFRTNLRDPLDMIFVFASFAGGIAAGSGNPVAGFLGIGLFLSVMMAMRWFTAGARDSEAEVRVRFSPLADTEAKIKEVLRTVAQTFNLLKRRDGEKDSRLEYRITLKRGDNADIAGSLRAIAGVTEVTLDLGDGNTAGGGDDD